MLVTIIVLTASVAAATEVSVVWRYEKPSASTSLTVYSAADRTKVLAESCGSSIGSLDFTRLDHAGAGYFTVDDRVFDVFTDTEEGVSSCHRIYNDLIAIFECIGVHFDVPTTVTQSANCFTDEEAKRSFDRLKTRSIDVLKGTPHNEERTDSAENASGHLTQIIGSAMSRIYGRKRELSKRAR